MAQLTRAQWNAKLITGYKITQSDWVDIVDSFFALLNDELIIEASLATLDVDIESKLKVATFPIPEDLTFVNAIISVDVAPVGSSAIWDININGSTVLSTNIIIVAGQLVSSDPVFSTLTANEKDVCVVDCDQTGASTPGQNPVLYIKYKKR